MSLHAIKSVLELVPEASGFIKRAYVEEDFPTKDRDSTVASALEINFLTKVAGQVVDYDDVARVTKAVRLYGVGDEVRRLSGQMEKAASARAEEARGIEYELRTAEAIIESKCSGFMDIEKVASQSAALYDNYSEELKSDTVRLYAGAGKLNKEAALMALEHRARVTGRSEFTKLAEVFRGTNPDALTVEENRALAGSVVHFEKKAGYLGDFYKDAFMITKVAIDRSIIVNLGSKSVPAVTLQGLPKDQVQSMIGDDIADLLSGDLMNLKRGVEALPLPEKQLLARLCKC
jgi:3-deoxy-D-manno-octulosonate 8-phosphate phosphatase KdsC-like HAD superfamily phosphatase